MSDPRQRRTAAGAGETLSTVGKYGITSRVYTGKTLNFCMHTTAILGGCILQLGSRLARLGTLRYARRDRSYPTVH